MCWNWDSSSYSFVQLGPDCHDPTESSDHPVYTQAEAMIVTNLRAARGYDRNRQKQS